MTAPAYTLIEGHHRVKAACKRGLGDLEVICYLHDEVKRKNPLKEQAVARRIKLSQLLPDAQNRQLREWFVEDIARNFDFGKWTPPVVRNGGEAQDDRIGEIYIGVNNTTPSTPAEKFLYRLRANDQIAVAVAGIVEACGYDGITARPEEGKVHCPTACEWVFGGGLFKRRTGQTPAALTYALEAVKRTYGRGAIRPELVRGFGSFAHRYPKVPVAELARKVKSRHPEPQDLLKATAVMREAMGNCHVAKATALVVRLDYNVGRKSGALEDWG